MFLKSCTDLTVRFSAICRELLWCPPSTIVEVASDVQRRGQQLLDEVELGELAGMFNERPRIEVGERPFNDRIASLPFRLWAEDHGHVPWSLCGSWRWPLGA